KEKAREFAERALSTPVSMPGFVDISGIELADASLRFSEDYCPSPDLSLDAYWAAMRGIPTVFPPLVFNQKSKEYAKMISLPAIGVGVSVDGKSSTTGPILNVVILQLVDPHSSVANPYVALGATAIDALWAGDLDQGTLHLDALKESLSNSNAPPDQVEIVGR